MLINEPYHQIDLKKETFESINIEQVYNELLPCLLFSAYGYLRNKAESEDVVSEIFERMLRKNIISSNIFDDADELKAYLLIAVKNACIDLLRAKKRKIHIIEKIITLFPQKSASKVFHIFEKEAFELMVKRISAREREVIDYHLKGYNNKEIAIKLNVSELTVRNTLHNAKKRIRKLWNIFMQ
jgi:RNA polymerase sigma factor (sigma-70 family)